MGDNLRLRILSAVVLVPVLVGAVLWLPSDVFALVLGAFMLAGAWEWPALAGRPARGPRIASVLLAGVSIVALLAAVPVGRVLESTLWAGALWWLAALVWVVRFQRGASGATIGSPLAGAAIGWLILVPAWAALYLLHRSSPEGPSHVLALLVLIWVADSGAYFAGRRFGRARLASRVSPGKTMEGVAGGLACVAVLCAGLAWYRPSVFGPMTGFVTLGVITALVSVLGDLTESMFKRSAGIKDSGTLIPGHGGALDRIDSVTAAAPCFALGMLAIGATS